MSEEPDNIKWLHILFVDEDDFLCQSMAYYFRRKVFSFQTAHTGGQALQKFREKHIDIVICDEEIGDMTAPNFFADLDAIRPGAKKILVVNRGSLWSEEHKRLSGIDAFLSKPYHAEHIKEALIRTAAMGERKS